MLLMVVALVGAVAFVVMRERGQVGWPLPQPGAGARHASLAGAEHARASTLAEVGGAGRRGRARADDAPSGLQAGGFAQPAPYGAPRSIDGDDTAIALGSPLAADPHALEARWRAARDADPMDDPRYADPRYDGRLAADFGRSGRGGRTR